jgi:glycosyltransferase involved in cell wall biosynthesis
MKVLHVETGRHLYGGGKQVLYLLQGLQEMQAGAHFLACVAGGELEAQARFVAEGVHGLPWAGDLDISWIWRLRHLLRKIQADILHVHSRGPVEIWAGMAAVGCKARTVLTRRVDNPEPWWQVKLKYPFFDQVISISAGVSQVLLQQGLPAAKLSCVPSGVDTKRYAPGCEYQQWFRQELGLAEKDIPLGVLAQLIPRKGHTYILQALPEILSHYPEAKVLFFGQGPLQSRLQEQAEALGLQDRVVFAGFRSDLEFILPCLKVLIHPALLEGLGVSLLQAAAAGVPIVAFRAGGVPEVVQDGENGFLVQPGQFSPLARAVLKLLKDPELAQTMGQRGRELVCEGFSRQSMALGNLRVYQGLLQGHPAHK